MMMMSWHSQVLTGMQSPCFLWDSDSVSNSSPKKPGLRLQLQAENPTLTPTQGLILLCDILIVYLRMT